jgi:replicative DNA helicase
MENSIEKLPPHNIQAEEATIGAMLIDPDAVLKVREIAHPRDFYISRNQWVYAAYLTAIDAGNEAPDYVTLCTILEHQGRLEEIGGAAFITSLINKTPTALNVEHYARIVARTGYLRRAIAAAQRIAQVAYQDDETGIDAKQDEIERLVFDLAPTNDGDGMEHIRTAMSDIHDEMARRHNGDLPPGVKTGFYRLDQMTGGLQKSDLIIVAARPSMGKTALMLDIARNASRLHGKRVAVFSLEMSKAQIVQRLIASQSDINSTTLRTGRLDDKDWPVFVDVTGRLGAAEIYIDDRAALTASKMRSSLRRLMAKVDIDLIVIDYLQRMSAGRRVSGLYEKTAQLSSDCKNLAKEFNLPVMVGSQLSRACEQRSDKRPLLSDLRDSGTLEEDADIVAFIYRDEYYNENTEQPNTAEINLAKHRNGKTGMFPLFFKKSAATFKEIQVDEVIL